MQAEQGIGATARDIGADDTCVQGCAYCYAVSSREKAQRMLGRIDESSEFPGTSA